MKNFSASLLLAALFLFTGCQAFRCPECPKPQGENRSAGISYAWKGNEIFLIRDGKFQEISAFHPLSDVQFFSASAAPVIVAATLESGYPGRTILRIKLPGKDRPLTEAELRIIDPAKQSGKRPVIQKVTGISADGTTLDVITDRPVRLDLRTGKITGKR